MKTWIRMSVVALAVVASQTFNIHCIMSEYSAKHQYVGQYKSLEAMTIFETHLVTILDYVLDSSCIENSCYFHSLWLSVRYTER